MVRIRRKLALILTGVTLFVFLMLYVILNHSMPAEKPVSSEYVINRRAERRCLFVQQKV